MNCKCSTRWGGCGLSPFCVGKLRGLWGGKDLPEGTELERVQCGTALHLHPMLFPLCLGQWIPENTSRCTFKEGHVAPGAESCSCRGSEPMTDPDGTERLDHFSPDQDSTDGPPLSSFSLCTIPWPSLPSVSVEPKGSPY